MKKLRSIQDGRPSIQSINDVLKANYGAADIRKINNLTRGEYQSWSAQGIIRSTRTDGGVRIFEFRTLLAAEIAKTLARQSRRTSLGVINAVIDELRNRKIDPAEAIDPPKAKPVTIEVEIPDVDTDAAGESDSVVVEPLGSPLAILVRVDVTRVAQALAKKIISQAKSSE